MGDEGEGVCAVEGEGDGEVKNEGESENEDEDEDQHEEWKFGKKVQEEIKERATETKIEINT